MTNIKIEKLNNHIVKVEANGHSGYNTKGNDVLCAGISAIIQTAVLGILKIAKIDTVEYETNENGYLILNLPNKLSAEQQTKTDCILETMLLGLKDLKEGYSNYINLEVIENVY